MGGEQLAGPGVADALQGALDKIRLIEGDGLAVVRLAGDLAEDAVAFVQNSQHHGWAQLGAGEV